MSATFTEAVESASWWLRYALDRAPDEPGIHVGAIAHLTSARAQMTAVEKLTDAERPSQPHPHRVGVANL